MKVAILGHQILKKNAREHHLWKIEVNNGEASFSVFVSRKINSFENTF